MERQRGGALIILNVWTPALSFACSRDYGRASFVMQNVFIMFRAVGNHCSGFFFEANEYKLNTWFAALFSKTWFLYFVDFFEHPPSKSATSQFIHRCMFRCILFYVAARRTRITRNNGLYHTLKRWRLFFSRTFGSSTTSISINSRTTCCTTLRWCVVIWYVVGHEKTNGVLLCLCEI